MVIGSRIAGRFEVEREVGVGGMASVYRARDLKDGGRVALKLLRGKHATAAYLAREADVLSSLDHPGIVRYVAHGETGDGGLYLAMQWIDGETLAERIKQTRLTVAETLTLGQRLAGALARAHDGQIIHRDVKPENVLLPGGRLDAATLVDFGIARTPGMGPQTTSIVGTPMFMAPEQACGDHDLDRRADIFSLGCVLYACLVGQSPFAAGGLMAVLARIVLDSPAPLTESRPDVPPGLEQLLLAMLKKDPAERPADAHGVCERLAGIEAGSGAPASVNPRRASLTPAEERYLPVVVACPRSAPGASGVHGAAESHSFAIRVGADHGLKAVRLADGSIVLTASTEWSVDAAESGARCAMALRGMFSDLSIAVATGRCSTAGPLPFGEAVERAESLARSGSAHVVVDALTASLLPSRFQREPAGHGVFRLLAESSALDAPRAVLGKPMPYLGRRKEHRMLGAIVEECFEDGLPQAALLVGPSGIGKSRLCHELLHGDLSSWNAEIWPARADSVRGGTPYSLIAHSLRSAPLPDDLSSEEQEVLAEIAPSSAADTPEGLASVGDPMVRYRRLFRVVERVVRHAVERSPVVLLWEDLQWADGPSLELIGELLRSLPGGRLLLLGTAKPEGTQGAPRVPPIPNAQRIELHGLPPEISRRIVQEVLGDRIDAEGCDSIVRHAQGNPFLLEELVRAAASGEVGEFPGSVLALVQSQIAHLDARTRMVLRAGSVFGMRFWTGAVQALVEDLTPAQLREALLRLAGEELITAGDGSRFAGDSEHAFSHSLVCQATYAMLTPEDRRLGHQLAADWLLGQSERDPLELAHHFDQAEDPGRAVPFLCQAAKAALRGNDFERAIGLGDEAVARGAQGAVLATVRLLQAEAYKWRGNYAEARRLAGEAVNDAPPASDLWYVGVAESVTTSLRSGDLEALRASAAALVDAGTPGSAEAVTSLARSAMALFYAGDRELGQQLRSLARGAPATDASARAWLANLDALEHSAQGDLAACLDGLARAQQAYREAGDPRRAVNVEGRRAYQLLCCGLHAEAVESLERTLATAEQLQLGSVAADFRHSLGWALALDGEHAAGRAMEERAMADFEKAGDKRLLLAARLYLARIHLLAGTSPAALALALDAVGRIEAGGPRWLAWARAVVADIHLSMGDSAEALRWASEAIEELGKDDSPSEELAYVRAVYAGAAFGAGQVEEARAMLLSGHRELIQAARRISDPKIRDSFLKQVPAHRRLAELLEQVGIAESEPA